MALRYWSRNHPPPLYDDPAIRTLIAEHAATLAPYAQALSREGVDLDERGILCIADIDEPASATYAELAAGYAKHGTWLPLPDGVKTTTYRPSSDTPATPPEGREQEWAILTGTDASLRSIRTWPWLGEVFGLSDGAYLLTRLWPCSFAVLAGDLWFEKSSAKRWGSTPPRVFPADELSGLRVKQLARYDDIVVHLGNSAVAVAPPKPQPNAVRPWKTVHL